MSKDFKGELWDAPPHTKAKIQILKDYLASWCYIFGLTHAGKDLLIVDGFAGPGEYANDPDGSPVVGLRSALTAASDSRWRAGKIHYALIERDPNYFENLVSKTKGFASSGKIIIHALNASFVEGMETLRRDLAKFFTGRLPLFAFVDPFGPTGAPFSELMAILGSPASEVLLNFDHDGILRIYYAYRSKAQGWQANENNLNSIFGNEAWKTLANVPEKLLPIAVLNLYKENVKTIRNVEFVFSFEMRDSRDMSSYHLLFASQHREGLRKMKEAMRKIDQSGSFTFSDARVGQDFLFRFDDPEAYAMQIYDIHKGQTVTRSDIDKYILLNTPFHSLAPALGPLDEKGLLRHLPADYKRRRKTFAEDKVSHIVFK